MDVDDVIVIEDEETVESPAVAKAAPKPLRPVRRFCNVYGCLVNTDTFPNINFFPLPSEDIKCV